MGLGFLITVDQVPGKRSPGSLSWGGINNTFFWIDSTRGIAGVIMMQYLPFADAKALAALDTFERATYQLVNGGRAPAPADRQGLPTGPRGTEDAAGSFGGGFRQIGSRGRGRWPPPAGED